MASCTASCASGAAHASCSLVTNGGLLILQSFREAVADTRRDISSGATKWRRSTSTAVRIGTGLEQEIRSPEGHGDLLASCATIILGSRALLFWPEFQNRRSECPCRSGSSKGSFNIQPAGGLEARPPCQASIRGVSRTGSRRTETNLRAGSRSRCANQPIAKALPKESAHARTAVDNRVAW